MLNKNGRSDADSPDLAASLDNIWWKPVQQCAFGGVGSKAQAWRKPAVIEAGRLDSLVEIGDVSGALHEQCLHMAEDDR